MAQISPNLISYDVVEANYFTKIGLQSLKLNSGKLNPDILKSSISDFYLTDPISRASITMSKCSKVFKFYLRLLRLGKNIKLKVI